MNVASPDLLTLVDWAERLAAGERCVRWESWRAAAPDAAWKWERITQAQAALDGATGASDTESEISAEDVAQYFEGRLAEPDADRMEQACWQSTPLLAELISATRFARVPAAAAMSEGLQSRLVALLPKPALHNGNGKPPKFRLAPREDPPSDTPPPPADVRVFDPRSFLARWQWPLFAAALVLAIAVSGAVGWLAATLRNAERLRQPIARGPVDQVLQPPQDVRRPPRSPDPPRHEPLPNTPPPNVPQPPDTPDAAPPPTSAAPPPAVIEVVPPAPSVRPPSPPKHRPPLAAPARQLAIRSVQGLLLLDAGQQGQWRAAPASFALDRPTNLLSLPESWTTVEVPPVGTLILEGTSEATLATLRDGTLEIQLVRGHLGIENMKAGAEIHLRSNEVAWTVHSTADNATFAVVYDPLSPGLVVVRGAVTVNDSPVAAEQIIRWQDGLPLPPQPLGASPSDQGSLTQQTPLTPPAVNPWNLAWIAPPDENSARQWRNIYGRLADRVAAADDVGSELAKLADSTRDPRHAALLARWNVAATNVAMRPQQTWNILADRRPAVRAAGVKCLLELPPDDERLIETTRLLEDKVGRATASRVSQWVDTAWQPGAPPQVQAAELVDHLQHDELAIRQIAVSLLVLHTEVVFQQAGIIAPAYDAAAPANRRTEAQVQWRAILRQLYTPTRKGPMLIPANPTQQRPALQNASPAAASGT